MDISSQGHPSSLQAWERQSVVLRKKLLEVSANYGRFFIPQSTGKPKVNLVPKCLVAAERQVLPSEVLRSSLQCIFPPPFGRSPLGQEKKRFFRFLVGLVLVFPWLHFGVLGFHFGLRGSMACFLAALWKSRKAIFRVQKSCRFGRQKIKNN